MAIREILIYPDARLRKRAQPCKAIGAEVERLAEDLFETMEAYDGVGLAAPQVGVFRRVFVLREPGGGLERCFVNPEIFESEGSEFAEEGCLSVPQVYAPVSRHMTLRVRAFDQYGEPFELSAEGLLARIIQHESDHLDGLVFLDRLDVLTHEAKLQEWKQVREQMLTAGRT